MHPGRSIFVAALLSLFVAAGVALASLVWANRSSSAPVQPPAAALQVPEIAQAAQTMQVPGAIPSEVPTFDPRTLLPTYPTLPTSPGPRTPIPTRPIAIWTALVPGVDPSFDEPPNPPPTVFATPRPTFGPNDPWGGIIYGYRQPEPKKEAKKAQLIIVGTVQDVGVARWTTSDGKRPANPFAKSNQDTIFRPVTVAVESVIKGSSKQGDIIVEAYGGTVGQDSVEWASDDLFKFNVGDHVVLYLDQYDLLRDHQVKTKLSLWPIIDHYTLIGDSTAVNSYRKLQLSTLQEEIAAAVAESKP